MALRLLGSTLNATLRRSLNTTVSVARFPALRAFSVSSSLSVGPRSAFILYSMDHRQDAVTAVTESGGKATTPAVASKLGEMWNSLGSAAQAEYHERAAADKQRHLKELADAVPAPPVVDKSAYVHWVRHSGITSKIPTFEIGATWGSMSEEEKLDWAKKWMEHKKTSDKEYEKWANKHAIAVEKWKALRRKYMVTGIRTVYEIAKRSSRLELRDIVRDENEKLIKFEALGEKRTEQLRALVPEFKRARRLKYRREMRKAGLHNIMATEF
jgi:hypothetical protein